MNEYKPARNTTIIVPRLAYSVFRWATKGGWFIKKLFTVPQWANKYKPWRVLVQCSSYWVIRALNTYQFHRGWSHPDNGTSQGHRPWIYHLPQKSPEGRWPGKDGDVSVSKYGYHISINAPICLLQPVLDCFQTLMEHLRRDSVAFQCVKAVTNTSHLVFRQHITMATMTSI